MRGVRLKNFCEDLFFFGKHLRLCPWSLALASSIPVLPRKCLSSERLSLALASDFFCVLGLGLEPCVLDSISARLGYERVEWKCCCCCSAYLSSCHRTASDANLLDDPHTFHYNDCFVIGGIRTCLGVSDDPMFLWISSNSCLLNLLLVRNHQAEIIIVKRLIQGRNNVTRVRVEPRLFD